LLHGGRSRKRRKLWRG
jgi:hypothetical protein